MNAIRYIFWEGRDGKVNGLGTIAFVVVMSSLFFGFPLITGDRDQQMAEINQIYCPELKERIQIKNYDGFWEPWAKIDMPHNYEYRCK